MIDPKFKIFQMVWELRSFSAAAAMLGMSQPNATQQLKKLEKELGVKLFDRDTRSIELTAAGRMLLRELAGLDAAADHLRLKLAGLRTGSRHFAIGGTLTAGSYVLPALMARFMAENRKIALHLVIGNTETIAEKVQQHILELALVEGPFDRNLFLYRKFDDDELQAAGSPDVVAAEFSLTRYLKRGGRLLLREAGSGTRHSFDRFCREHAIEVPGEQIITVQGFEAVKALAAAGTGVAILSPLICVREVNEGSLCCAPLLEGRILREFNFIYSAAADLELVGRLVNFCCRARRELRA
ncbi:MAG: LysR family transcriptional regulator [Victivallaceae bacterium]